MDAPTPPEKQTELLLDALKAALAVPGEHRLFRAGKLPGLFPARTGPAADAALAALSHGWLETVRTETKGKLTTEWVRGTPKGVAFVHDHDSPKAVLRELRDLLQTTRAGVPAWMDEARREAEALRARFEDRAADVLKRLDDLAVRVEGALRRAEAAGPGLADPVAKVVPWALDALEYLDHRPAAGSPGDCPLPDLFHAVRVRFPDLSLPAFQDGLRRLHDVRAVRLSGGANGESFPEPEYAMVVDGRAAWWVSR